MMAHVVKSNLTEQQQEFWTLVQKINNCWRHGRPTELSAYFHQNVVFNSPDFKHQITGKENCIQTYIDFLNISNIIDYVENNPAVHIFKKTAITTYHFEMKYEQKGNMFQEMGTDTLAFENGTSWKVVWRAVGNVKNV